MIVTADGEQESFALEMQINKPMLKAGLKTLDICLHLDKPLSFTYNYINTL